VRWPTGAAGTGGPFPVTFISGLANLAQTTMLNVARTAERVDQPLSTMADFTPVIDPSGRQWVTPAQRDR